jgi:F-type H+-transporting ATPase subunit b
MKKLIMLCALALSTVAYAQTPDEADKKARVDDAAGMPNSDSEGHKQEGQEAEGEPDPSTHFNYFNFSYSGKDEFGGKYGDGVETDTKGNVHHEEEPMSPPFIFMIANFAILIWLLVKYLLPAGQKMSEERHDAIKNALDEAAKLRDQAKAKLAEYEARVKNLDAEIKSLVDGIRADAEADKARIFEQAQQQAAQLKKEAEQRIAAEIELARTQLTKEVTAAATQATEKLLKEKVTADDQRGLVTTFIKNVEQQRAS